MVNKFSHSVQVLLSLHCREAKRGILKESCLQGAHLEKQATDSWREAPQIHRRRESEYLRSHGAEWHAALRHKLLPDETGEHDFPTAT